MLFGVELDDGVILNYTQTCSLPPSISISWFACLFVLLTPCITSHFVFSFAVAAALYTCYLLIYFLIHTVENLRCLCYVICGVFFSFSSCLRSKMKRPEYEERGEKVVRVFQKSLCTSASSAALTTPLCGIFPSFSGIKFDCTNTMILIHSDMKYIFIAVNVYCLFAWLAHWYHIEILWRKLTPTNVYSVCAPSIHRHIFYWSILAAMKPFKLIYSKCHAANTQHFSGWINRFFPLSNLYLNCKRVREICINYTFIMYVHSLVHLSIFYCVQVILFQQQ